MPGEGSCRIDVTKGPCKWVACSFLSRISTILELQVCERRASQTDELPSTRSFIGRNMYRLIIVYMYI